MAPLPIFPLVDVARTFNKAAPRYDHYAFIQHEMGLRLLSRLDILTSSPRRILDIGAGTGKLTQALQMRFPESTVIGLDLAHGMLKQAQHKKALYVGGDMHQLPIQNQSIDLIFSNFTLQWSHQLPLIFSECKRILSPQGALFFTTLGPDTLYELRDSFASIDDYQHVHPFFDMHDIGDMLLHCPLQNPVVDKDNITLVYPSVQALLRDLKGTGTHNLTPERRRGLTPRHIFQGMQQAYEQFRQPDGTYPLTYEVIYGHAWHVPSTQYTANAEGIVTFPADHIPLL